MLLLLASSLVLSCVVADKDIFAGRFFSGEGTGDAVEWLTALETARAQVRERMGRLQSHGPRQARAGGRSLDVAFTTRLVVV